ncbi:hypothetical protein GCM10029976_042460 [Kribbella albertanoniae]
MYVLLWELTAAGLAMGLWLIWPSARYGCATTQGKHDVLQLSWCLRMSGVAPPVRRRQTSVGKIFAVPSGPVAATDISGLLPLKRPAATRAPPLVASIRELDRTRVPQSARSGE